MGGHHFQTIPRDGGLPSYNFYGSCPRAALAGLALKVLQRVTETFYSRKKLDSDPWFRDLTPNVCSILVRSPSELPSGAHDLSESGSIVVL